MKKLIAAAMAVGACAAHANVVNFSVSESTSDPQLEDLWGVANSAGSYDWSVYYGEDDGNTQGYTIPYSETFMLTGGTGSTSFYMPTSSATVDNYEISGPAKTISGTVSAFQFPEPYETSPGISTIAATFGVPVTVIFDGFLSLGVVPPTPAQYTEFCGIATSTESRCEITYTSVGAGSTTWGTLFVPEGTTLTWASDAKYSVESIPEPDAFVLLGLGLGALALTRRS